MTQAAPEGASPAPGFFGGVRCFWSGLVFLLKTPGAWPLALVPTVIVVVLGSLFAFLAVQLVPPWVADLWGRHMALDGPMGDVVGTGLQVIATLLALLLSFLAAFSLAQPLSGPALEALVRRQEAELGAPTRPETPFVTDILRSLQSSLVGFLLGTPVLLVLLVIGLLFPPAQIVTIPLKALVVTTVLAWDLTDYPLSVRGVPVGTRVAFLRSHLPAVLGMSGGVALLALIPCGVLLAIPIGVAGATRLVHEIERAEGVRTR